MDTTSSLNLMDTRTVLEPKGKWIYSGTSLEAYLKDMGMTGLASAWATARRRPKDYRRKLDAATRCSGVRPHT